MRVIFLSLLFGFVGLVASYAVFGHIRGEYISPEFMVEALVGYSSYGNATVSKLFGVEDKVIIILASTAVAGFFGFVVGCLSLMAKGESRRSQPQKPQKRYDEMAHRPRIPKDESSGLDGYSDRRLKTGIKYLTK